MNHNDVIPWVSGALQLTVALYALRLNRIFGTARVGWSLFTAFSLLAILHLMQSTVPQGAPQPTGIPVGVAYGLISLLLLTVMAHIESTLKNVMRAEQEDRLKRVELEKQVKEQTQSLMIANQELQMEVAERERVAAQMDVTYQELLTASRQAGMSEVASNVLHNVGNVLNSVNISATLVSDHLNQFKISNIARVAAMMREHSADLGNFLTNDPKGKQFPAYLTQLSEHLIEEQALLVKEMGFVKKKIEHIKDIIAMQQNYAKVTGVTETVMITDLVEDAIHMNSDALLRHDVEIIKEFDPHLPEVTLEKHKVLQILVNLIRNAKYACDESGRKDKRMTLRVQNAENKVRIVINDNGVGIPPENLTKIFNHGFTTRKGGHGFGLHGGALAAKEMGGTLKAHSEGIGKGATFTLELPLKGKKNPQVPQPYKHVS